MLKYMPLAAASLYGSEQSDDGQLRKVNATPRGQLRAARAPIAAD
jgi:hypothetical protein